MNHRTFAPIFLALAFACSGLAVQAMPYGPDCPTEDNSNADGDEIQCLVIAGPASVSHKSLISVGAGACFDPATPGQPIPCNTPGAISGAGAAIFENDGMNGISADEHLEFSAWVRYNEELPCLVVAGITPCGFDMLLCNDRDWDGICTNVNDFDDQLRSTTSNEAILGGGYLVCIDPVTGLPCAPSPPMVGGDCTDKDKDLKDCPDPRAAESRDIPGGAVDNCFIPHVDYMSGTGPTAWLDGQLIVFVGAWVDSWPGFNEPENPVLPGDPAFPTNIGAGVSAGTYDVWLKWSDCDPEDVPQCDNKIDDDFDTFRDLLDENGGDPECVKYIDDDESA